MSDLPSQGLKLNKKIEVAPLNRRLSEGTPCEMIFTSDPEIDITITPLPEGGELSGKISAEFSQPCGRCLDERARKIEVPLTFYIKPGEPSEIGDDEPGVILYLGDHVDIEQTLHDSLILNLTQHWCPEITPEGKCIECNKRVDSLVSTSSSPESGKVSLASLLKKAGVQ